MIDSARPRFRAWAWVPYLVLALVVGAWAVTHSGAVLSGAGSPKAWAFGIGTGVLFLAALFGVARLTRRGWAGQLAGLVPLVVAAVVAVLPSYVVTEVDQAAPEGLVEIDGGGPPASAAPSTAGAGTEPVDSTDPAASTTAPAPTTPTGPVRLGSADFTGIDHDVVGSASLIRLADGSLLVRFEGFTVEPGPDYDVYVGPGRDVQRPTGVRLGDLAGTTGDQNYDVPAAALPDSGPVTVLIWCELFDVPVANSTIG